MDNAAYQEHGYGANQLTQHLSNHQMGGHQLYYPPNGVQRPQSTEPRDYRSHTLSQVPLPTDWAQTPPDPRDNRQGPYGMWRRPDMQGRGHEDMNGH